MITTADLKTQSKSELGRLAKGLGVSGWQTMRKEDLIAVLAKRNKAKETAKPAKKKAEAKPSAISKQTAAKVPQKKTAKAARVNGSNRVKAVVADKKVATKAVAKGSLPKATNVSKPSAGKSIPVKETAAKVPAAKPTPSKPTSERAVADRLLTAKPAASKTLPSNEGKSVQAKPTAKPVVKDEAKDSKNLLKSSSAKKLAPVAKAKPQPIDPKHAKALANIRKAQEEKEIHRDLAQPALPLADPSVQLEKIVPVPGEKDRIILVVRDPYWLQASWDIGRRSIDRAKAAMAEHWHTARPVLRLLKLNSTGTTDASETIERDIEIHGGVRNWFVDVKNPPNSYRIMLGYLGSNGRFHTLCKSNIVRTPVPGSADAVDGNWTDIAQDCERIFALSGGYNSEHEATELQEVFEDRLKRPVGTPALAQFGSGAEGSLKRRREFQFEIDAEMILFGTTQADAYVTLGGEPVKIRDDGTFSVRLPLPDRRQVVPAVASSRDGVEQRTIVIAVERNTKVMEPLTKESEE